MSLKKFISGISAFAVAVSAFAAMTVTADAKTREITRDVYGTPTSNITSNNDGTYTVSNTNLGAIIADFSALQDIDDATSVTVQFDTKLPTVTSGGKSYIAPVMFGIGDKAVRGTNGNGSTKSDYVKAGLAAYFGSENGTSYYINGTGTNWATSVKDTDVRATITLNRKTGAYTGKLQTSGASVPFSGTTDVDNLTVLEVTTRGLSGYTFTFKNIKVSYTVPYAPTASVPVEVDLGDLATGDSVHAKAFTSDITYDGIAITNVKVEVPGSKEGSQILPIGNISGDVSIGIILAAKDALKLEGVTPTITVNAD